MVNICRLLRHQVLFYLTRSHFIRFQWSVESRLVKSFVAVPVLFQLMMMSRFKGSESMSPDFFQTLPCHFAEPRRTEKNKCFQLILLRIHKARSDTQRFQCITAIPGASDIEGMHCGLDQDASGMRQQFPKIYFSKIWKSNVGVPPGLGFRKTAKSYHWLWKGGQNSWGGGASSKTYLQWSACPLASLSRQDSLYIWGIELAGMK